VNPQRSGWRFVRAEDVAAPGRSIVSGPFGSNIGKRFFVDDGVPVIRGNNLTKGEKLFVDDGFVFLTEEKAAELRNCEAIPGDLVVTAAGTLGQVGLIPRNARYDRYIISNKQLRLRPNCSEVEPLYLYYWFSSSHIRRHLEASNTGSSIPLINLSVLRAVPISLPPLQTQRRIAAVLSTYDELIENNLRRIRILEDMAQALYREWFVEFRFPGREKLQKVSSEVGSIPFGWSVKRLGEVITLEYGEALRADKRERGPVPVFGSSGVVGFHSVSLTDGPGIIVGRKGNVGSVYWSDGPFFPIDTVYYVRTSLDLKYAFFNLQTQNFINNDAAVPGLNRNQAYSLPVVIPPVPLQEKFSGFVEPVFLQLRLLRKRNENLRFTRDLLLPRLISGELDVSDLDIAVPETVA